jgi:sulfite reductase alpha subunit-like flavoprotein
MKRVLVAYGSETGGTHAQIKMLVKKWQADGTDGKFDIVGVFSGNELAKTLSSGTGGAQAKNLDYLLRRCDVLLVATSSYGHGDPPSNYGEWMKLLSHEASMRSDALTGLQHAVLGFGSTTYPTFQNIPRLSDKMLGECGSRRLVRRAEIDEHDTDEPPKDLLRWSADVFTALQQPLPGADTPSCCEWTSPGDTISALDADGDGDKDETQVYLVYALGAVALALILGLWLYSDAIFVRFV